MGAVALQVNDGDFADIGRWQKAAPEWLSSTTPIPLAQTGGEMPCKNQGCKDVAVALSRACIGDNEAAEISLRVMSPIRTVHRL